MKSLRYWEIGAPNLCLIESSSILMLHRDRGIGNVANIVKDFLIFLRKTYQRKFDTVIYVTLIRTN